jgi:SAM-dependent methyltransferase
VRTARRAAARWSASDDRRFHDELFAGRSYDPFAASYPGYITIRRFADLAAAHFGEAKRVLDLGCGPGEITCELARRYPDISFLGVDHSATAVARAMDLASRIAVANIRFERGDIAEYVPADRVDLVVMFDSFHHLTAPREFVSKASRYADRFFLIEPAGDALGRWRRSIDCDWIALELEKLRARIEHTLGVPPPALHAPEAPAAQAMAGRATENRYSEDDYLGFFSGRSVSFQGTVAGLDVYPPAP